MPSAQGRSFKILKERLHPQLQVDGETELIRYMKPTTLLLLFGGKVFIPTLSKLQESDRLEAMVPYKALSQYVRWHGSYPTGRFLSLGLSIGHSSSLPPIEPDLLALVRFGH